MKACEGAAQSEDWNFPAEVSQLLKEIQSRAARLTDHAQTLSSYSHSGISRVSHASQLMSAKDHINEIGGRLERLQGIRHVAAPWQQQAIDSIVPVAANVATHTEAAIEHLNQNPNHLWAPVYKERVRSLANRADEMKKSVDLHLELASTQERLEELRSKLSVMGS
jgi:methyl-accepting chemotaxis protein